MQGTVRALGALVEKCAADALRNPGLLVIIVMPIGFALLYRAMLGGVQETHGLMSWYLSAIALVFSTTMAPPTVSLYTMALDREQGALRTLALAGVGLKRLALARGIASVLITTAVTALCLVCTGESAGRLLPITAVGLVAAVVMTLFSLVPSAFARNQTDSGLYCVPILLVGLGPMFFQYSEALVPATAYLPTGGAFVLAQLAGQGLLLTPEAVLPVVSSGAWIAVGAFALAVALRRAPRDDA